MLPFTLTSRGKCYCGLALASPEDESCSVGCARELSFKSLIGARPPQNFNVHPEADADADSASASAPAAAPVKDDHRRAARKPPPPVDFDLLDECFAPPPTAARANVGHPHHPYYAQRQRITYIEYEDGRRGEVLLPPELPKFPESPRESTDEELDSVGCSLTARASLHLSSRSLDSLFINDHHHGYYYNGDIDKDYENENENGETSDSDPFEFDILARMQRDLPPRAAAPSPPFCPPSLLLGVGNGSSSSAASRLLRRASSRPRIGSTEAEAAGLIPRMRRSVLVQKVAAAVSRRKASAAAASAAASDAATELCTYPEEEEEEGEVLIIGPECFVPDSPKEIQDGFEETGSATSSSTRTTTTSPPTLSAHPVVAGGARGLRRAGPAIRRSASFSGWAAARPVVVLPSFSPPYHCDLGVGGKQHDVLGLGGEKDDEEEEEDEDLRGEIERRLWRDTYATQAY